MTTSTTGSTTGNDRRDAVPAEPVGYMERTRLYYAAQGYPRAYRWATYDSVPFSPLAKPLTETRLMLVTTASPIPEGAADSGAGAAPSALADTLLAPKALARRPVASPPSALFTADLSWDKEATHTDDLGSYFPLAELSRQVASGHLGGLTASYFCVPTEYSQRQTLEVDAPAIAAAAIEEGADAVLLVPL